MGGDWDGHPLELARILSIARSICDLFGLFVEIPSPGDRVTDH